MDELERVREEALLTDEKIFEVQQGITWDEYKKEIGASDALLVESYMGDSDFLKMVCEAQLDKALKHKRVHIEADNQELPKNPYAYPYDENGMHNPKFTIMSQQFEAYKLAQQDMLTPDSDGNVWVKCLKKEER